MSPGTPAIDPIAGSYMNTQLGDTLAYRFCVAKVSGLNLTQPNGDSSFRHFVPQAVDPRCERLSAILMPVADELDHGTIVA